MNKKIYNSLFIIVLFALSSCSNDFDLIADWEDIPVVYGFISIADTAHYIRLEKAFLDPEISPLKLAQIPDSIYYPDAKVKLVKTADNREYIFTKVDGNLEGYQRESGIFVDAPNWLYKLKTEGLDTLSPDTEYQLIINRSEDTEPITATTELITEINISIPPELSSLSFTNINNGTPLNPKVRWSYNKENTAVFNVNLTFFYEETIDGITQNKSFIWPLAKNLRANGTLPLETVEIDSKGFFLTVASNIEEKLTATRKFLYLELEVLAGGPAFRDYLDFNQANIGLTSSQVIPNFTNMSLGYGMFTSVFTVSQNNSINDRALDSLRRGQYTKLLNFE